MGTGRKMRRTVALWLLVPAGLAAQSGERLVCKDGLSPVGSLGITGISCDRCQFYTNGKVHQAVFWTEPTIENLDVTNPAATLLRTGDVLVAVDGQLITTKEGSARFSALPPDQEARLRIRRDGRLMTLMVPVAAACPTNKDAAAPVVAGRPLPVPPPPPKASERLVPAPPAPAAPKVPGGEVLVPPAPPVHSAPAIPAVAPAPPAPAAVSPRASLGFGFRCGPCGFIGSKEGPGRWTFDEAPEVRGISDPHAEGLKTGDRLVALNGADLTTEEGGRKFAEILPGDRLNWTVGRDGRRLEVTTTAYERDDGEAVAPALAADPSQGPLRYAGAVGNTTVEVRGGRVTVSEDEGGRLIIIRTGDAEIRIRAPAGGTSR